jgi:hypothetical protein
MRNVDLPDDLLRGLALYKHELRMRNVNLPDDLGDDEKVIDVPA